MTNPRTLMLSAAGMERDPDQSSVLFIGTATVLLCCGGFTILTDPNFLHRVERVRLGHGLRSTRRTNPALELEQLPAVDFILLSHLHGDHFDHVVEQRLDRSVPIVTTPHGAAALAKKGFRSTHGLHTWESMRVSKGNATVRITAMPGKHGPRAVAALLPPVMGSMLEFEGTAGSSGRRIYVSGDTLVYDELREIPRRYPQIDAGLFHLGGTRILGVLLTMDAKQGVEALRIVAPEVAIPIHYNDYTVFRSPARDFQRAVRAAGLRDRVRYLRRGETYSFAPAAGGSSGTLARAPVADASSSDAIKSGSPASPSG